MAQARHRPAPRSNRHWPILTGLLATVLAVALAGWTARALIHTLPVGATTPRPAPSPSAGPAPLGSAALYAEPDSPAVQQVRVYEARGRTADAAVIRRIADQAAAVWFVGNDRGFTVRARELVDKAAVAGAMPVLVASFLPDRDCDRDDDDGASGAAAYDEWAGALADAVSKQPAVVILEPNGVPQAVSGCLEDEAAITERYRLLRGAVTAFKANPQVRVYVGAGNPSWIPDTDKLAEGLREAGVERADGFALNVSAFDTTHANVTYGHAVSAKLGGVHFVVDTSRNGNGPPVAATGDRTWCNPTGRALGETPRTRTGDQLVDAYLWVKRPGESDGACGDGAPAAGVWWPAYALALARA